MAELTTQLLRLIGILWLPLCQINKLGNTYPRRLSRSPTVVGYHALKVAMFSSTMGEVVCGNDAGILALEAIGLTRAIGTEL